MGDEIQYCENYNKILQPGDLMLTIGNILGLEDTKKIILDDIYFCSFSCGEEWCDKDEDEW